MIQNTLRRDCCCCDNHLWIYIIVEVERLKSNNMNFKTGFKTALWCCLLIVTCFILLIQLLHIVLINVFHSKTCNSLTKCNDIGNKFEKLKENLSKGKPPPMWFLIEFAKAVLLINSESEQFHKLNIVDPFIGIGLICLHILVWYIVEDQFGNENKEIAIISQLILLVILFLIFLSLKHIKHALINMKYYLTWFYKYIPNFFINMWVLVCVGILVLINYVLPLVLKGLPNDITKKFTYWSWVAMIIIFTLVIISANVDKIWEMINKKPHRFKR